MEKTKLGISVGMLGALCYFLGFISTMSLIIVAGYILLFENSEWLKRTAVKAVAVVVAFAVLILILNSANGVFSAVNSFFALFEAETRFVYPSSLDALLRTVLNVTEDILLLVLGFKAFRQASVKVAVIDKTLDKHI